MLTSGAGLPRTLATVRAIAARFEVDLEGIIIRIIDQHPEYADYIRYLDAESACACTPHELAGAQIDLGPASFYDDDTLARTLIHERTHVAQLRAHGPPDPSELPELEREAYASERRVDLEGAW
jgi:hypothetical protein